MRLAVRLCGDQAHGAFSPHRSVAEAGEADQHQAPRSRAEEAGDGLTTAMVGESA